jgi:TolA-binding protein
MFLAPLFLAVALIVPNQPEAAPTPNASATPKVPLKEIGHVKAVTPFCKAFITHFNTSAQLMTSDDSQISFADFVLGRLKKDFEATDRVNRLHDDRLNLIEYVKRLQQQMPKLQEAINQLRRAAELTIDPEKAKEAREVAAQLQKSLDKEKQITNDTLGVVHAMMEQAAGADTRLTNLASPEFAAALPPASGADLPSRNPEAMDDIRSYLEMDRQRDRIGDAESAAMTGADTVLQGC